MTPGIEAVTMFRNVQLRVKQTIGQDPWLSFPSLPAVYFAGSKPPENVELMELTFWNSVKNSTNPEILNIYLQRYPKGVFATTARALIERIERQRQAEVGREDERRRQEEMKASVLEGERRRAQETTDFAEANRVEVQQRAENVTRAEELRKALDEVRMAREAATVAEQQRLAAVKAMEEPRLAREVAKKAENQRVAAVNAAKQASPQVELMNDDSAALTLSLQIELKRVGCDPGEVDGRWKAKTQTALNQFLAATKRSGFIPASEVLLALKAHNGPACVPMCGPGEKQSSGKCVPKDRAQPRADGTNNKIPIGSGEGGGVKCRMGPTSNSRVICK